MSEKIIELFWYSSKARELFPYINDYMVALGNWLDENEMDDEQLIRYMLAGLFLHYRAANHMGNEFTTNTYGEFGKAVLPSKTLQQFLTINKRLGHSIDTTDEYLRLLLTQDVAQFIEKMFDFVVMGSTYTTKR